MAGEETYPASTAALDADHPVELLGIDTFYVGKLNGVGKI